ncbi:MAG TPA: gluconate 2-dehydrogenase subunit 3 family protein [Candidatus Dormibacteraeota bacterium]|nr:gluconate 2-dehydrogenase subunit 3 family protein [Candidatus Dormibacteraeota bacterium]
MTSRNRRFPGFDVLEQRRHWDGRTREVVMKRLGPHGQARFFTPDEEPVCRALLESLLALEPDGVPVFELVDARLADGITDGWRYGDMPPDGETWRRSIAELKRHRFERSGDAERHRTLESIRTSERFAGMPGKRLWDLWMRSACTAYYSHPSAWNEIGFGGPAYPRGYKNLGLDRREPWEVEEVDARDPVPWARRVEDARQIAEEHRRAG